jgi:branched-chain amino acid transport system ATP-binding protein
MSTLLRLDNVGAGYGDIRILDGVSLAIGTGAVTALVGSNGAGKTTLMRTIAGLLPVHRGRIEFQGQDITHAKPAERVEAGIALVPEGRLIFPDLTVEENLIVGAFALRVRRKRERLLQAIYDRFGRLAERRHQKGGTLSGGEQQMLAIGRGLMSEPLLLLLDEPSLGLAPLIVKQLFETVRAINDRGITVVIVEQNVRATLENSRYAYVIENGRIAMEGGGRELIADPRVREAYLGL